MLFTHVIKFGGVGGKCGGKNFSRIFGMSNKLFATCTEMSNVEHKLNIDTINPAIKKVEYAVRGPIVIKAAEIEAELNKGVKKPFDKVIKANIGDCQAMGQKPITFIRQVIAACMCPDLMQQNVFPSDVIERAQTILSGIGSTGCYSASVGIEHIRGSAAKYISTRDGYPSNPNNIIITNGASSSVKLILEMFVSEEAPVTGVMIPIPQYPLYSATVDEFAMQQVGYYLDEGNNWALNIDELSRALTEARKTCNPRVLCVINPGNPTGQVLTYQNIEDIIKFCIDEELFLMADEVYQDNVYQAGAAFHSFKKVMMNMGPEVTSRLQLCSFHSTSKGYFGECGLRGGYVEHHNLSEDVNYQLNKLQSAQLGSNITGQLVLDCIMDPPIEGQPSYQQFNKEKQGVLHSLKERAQLTTEMLNRIEGITCNEVGGAMYAFPQIRLPQKAINEANVRGMQPDFMYCLELLEEYGILVVPGSGFGQREGTWHFRMTILPPIEDLKIFLERLEEFHVSFMKKYAD